MPAERFVRQSLLLLVLAFSAGATLSAEEELTELPPPKERERIGEVLGKPVYRDEIDERSFGEDGKELLEEELARLFCAPPMQKYLAKHKLEFEPTSAEMRAEAEHSLKGRKEAKKRFVERLKSIETKLAAETIAERRLKLIENRDSEQEVIDLLEQTAPEEILRYSIIQLKVQRHLHGRFGGRVQFQQFGPECVDAHRKLVQELEKNGDFKITDNALRAALYKQWDVADGSHDLTDDKDEIRKMLYPEWLPPEPVKTAAKPDK